MKLSFKQIIIIFMSIFLGGTLFAFCKQTNPFNGFIDSWLIVLIGMLITTSGSTYVHAQNESGRSIKGVHWKRVIIRAIVLVLIPLAIIRSIFDPAFVFLYLANCFWFGVWFDPLYNKFKSKRTGKKLPWWYGGSEALYDVIGGKLELTKYMIYIEAAGFIYFTILFFNAV